MSAGTCLFCAGGLAFSLGQMNRYEFINWYEDVRVGTRRLIAMVPEEAFDYRPHEGGPTLEMIMRAFASLEEQFIKGVCMGDWSDPKSATDVRRQMRDAFAEEANDLDALAEDVPQLESPEEILDQLDRVHQDALDVIAELSDEEFQRTRVVLPWGEEGTILRLLLGLVEREIHHRTQLFTALQTYGLKMSEMVIWGP